MLSNSLVCVGSVKEDSSVLGEVWAALALPPLQCNACPLIAGHCAAEFNIYRWAHGQRELAQSISPVSIPGNPGHHKGGDRTHNALGVSCSKTVL